MSPLLSRAHPRTRRRTQPTPGHRQAIPRPAAPPTRPLRRPRLPQRHEPARPPRAVLVVRRAHRPEQPGPVYANDTTSPTTTARFGSSTSATAPSGSKPPPAPTSPTPSRTPTPTTCRHCTPSTPTFLATPSPANGTANASNTTTPSASSPNADTRPADGEIPRANREIATRRLPCCGVRATRRRASVRNVGRLVRGCRRRESRPAHEARGSRRFQGRCRPAGSRCRRLRSTR